MAEENRFEVEYSDQALKNATAIVAYLREKFSRKEVLNFFQTLEDFEKIISIYPTLYAESPKLKLRRAVLSKVLSVYYKISKNKITVIAILDNRRDEKTIFKRNN